MIGRQLDCTVGSDSSNAQLIANRVIDLAEAKRMFDRAKVAYPESDEDLLDHLDPTSGFELDIGGLG